ncbi:MAG: SRPBCC family protein [Candidatus Neomarinimicrobiota bacterium]
MIIAIATAFLILVILYFIWETAQDQNLDLDYSVHYSPRQAEVETRIETEASPKDIWNVLTDLSNYPTWFPWIRKVRVTNEPADRWVHRHSLQHFRVEVGNRFKIRPFLLSPLTHCRFIALRPESFLSLEARFFPMNREIVTFSMSPASSLVEITYKATSRSLFNFMTPTLFSWRGKNVLEHLAERLPEVSYHREEGEAPALEETFLMDQGFVHALVAKALHEGDDILNNLTDRTTRAKAKSAYMKAKRSGRVPEVTPEAAEALGRYLAGDKASTTKVAPPPPSQDAQINELVATALAGDEEVISSVEDRVLRSRAKAALIKAKRSGVTPQIPGTEKVAKSSPAPETPLDDTGIIIKAAVKKALAGDMDAINAISDRIVRAKAKSAYMRAKRQRD